MKEPGAVFGTVRWYGTTGKDTFDVSIEERPSQCGECGMPTQGGKFQLIKKINARPTLEQNFPTIESAVDFARKNLGVP